jgi:predicted nucleic acid-binding protein
MNFLDTQIVSYALKGRKGLPLNDATIPSITANELLLVQSEKYTQANYYVPLLSEHLFVIRTEKDEEGRVVNRPYFRGDHPFLKSSTDRVLLDFGNVHPTVVEYGNLAISVLINERVPNIFYEATKFLIKNQRKVVRKRFDFLIENGLKCAPLTKGIVRTSMDLLQAFTAKHNLKMKFRNSLNDILILATAIESSAILFTEDSLLNSFALTEYAGLQDKRDDAVIIDFSNKPALTSSRKVESKGYMNNGWQAKFIRYGNLPTP